MIINKKILIVGGDLRQVHLVKLLSEKNEVYTLGLENSEGMKNYEITLFNFKDSNILLDYIIFPMPACIKEGVINTPFSLKTVKVCDVLNLATQETFILGGKIDQDLKEDIQKQSLLFYDYLKREEMAVLNAVPTAEGAIQIAMEELPTTIFDSNILIVGYGHIGKILSKLLYLLGAKVTVSARKFSDLAWIESNGLKSIHTQNIKDIISNFTLVINTVPANVLDEETLTNVKSSCLLIDLASKPGGINFNTANKLGIKTIWALSLPGKVAPITAGKIIFDTITNIDIERRSTKIE